MKTKLLSKKITQQTAFFTIALFLVSLMTFAQNSTSNDFIAGVTAFSAFAEENVPPDKVNLKEGAVDGDEATKWAGQSSGDRGEALILDLGGSYDLAEVQYLTVNAKTYQFQIWVSDSGTDEGDFENAFPDVAAPGYLLTNSDATYKSFILPETVFGAKYVMIKNYGRSDSSWNTIVELGFYSEGTASTKENELSGFSLYPNPAKNSFTLGNLSNKVNKVEVVNLLGKVVLSRTIDSFGKKQAIDTSFLANGLYLVKLSDTAGSLSASKKMLIQH